MYPRLLAGDFIITRHTKAIKVGDIVVVDTDNVGKVVKRVGDLNACSLTLIGDNPRLESSTCVYPHPRQRVVGKLLFNFRLPFCS